MRNWVKTFLILFAFGFLVNSNSLNNKFQMDDYFLLSNPAMSQTSFILSQWDPQNNKYFSGYYRPMAHMVYAFCYGSFKGNYWQYHLLNLFLFAFLASLIYLLIKKITENYYLGFLAGAFFLIHPINGIMVNNIVTSALSLQVIFIFAAILLLWESLERSNDRMLYFLSLLVSFLSLFWYDMGVMTPVYLSAVILLFRKDPLKAKLLYLLPFFMISLFYLFFRSCFLNGTPFLTGIAGFHMTGWEYLATLFQLISWYILKLLFLQGIVMQWVTPVIREQLFWNCFGLFSLLMVFFLILIRFAKEKIIQMAMIWILIGLAPVCLIGFENPGAGALVEPHWFIFSSIGFFVLIAYLSLIIINRIKVLGSVLLLIIVFVWSTASHAYNQVWADGKTYALFWSGELPDFKKPLVALGDAYEREGNYKEAMKYYRLSLKGNYNDPVALSNMGAIYLQDGHLKEAEFYLKLASMIEPDSVMANNDLGVIYLRQGQLDKAEKEFLKVLDFDPFLLAPRRGLATIALARSKYQEAIDLCFKNLDLKKGDPDTLMLLIEICIRQKDQLSLKKYAYRIINDENDPAVLTKLGALMALNNIVDIAQDCYHKALRVAPYYVDVYLDQGTLLENLGKYDEAVDVWEKGSNMNPSDQRFKKHIAKVMLLKSNHELPIKAILH